MHQPLLYWDIYEITSKEESLKGVMFRGRIRRFCLINHVNILPENAQDAKNVVRFALLHNESAEQVIEFIHSIKPSAVVQKIRERVPNPVVSKLQVNLEDRYTIEPS